MGLFDPVRLELFATEYGPGQAEAQRGLLVLRTLVGRRLDGSLGGLTETRVEQSFNERIFAEVFGYESVLRRGEGDFHIMAKNYYPAEGAARKGVDDLAIGFFGPGRDVPEIRASVELKDPGQDLDAPEGGGYGDRSPVRQAFERVMGRGIPWVIISNLFEVRVYSADDDRQFELVALTDIVSVAQFRRAYALLSRRTLLGDAALVPPDESKPMAPLLRLFQGGPPHVLPAHPNHPRLVHEAFIPGGADLPLHELEDGLLAAFRRMPQTGEYGVWPPHIPGVMAFELEEDRLVLAPTVDGHVIGRLEFSKAGILRVTEYLDPEGEPAAVSGAGIGMRLALFVLFARTAFSTSHVHFKWRLLDIAGSLCRVPAAWVGCRTDLLPASAGTPVSSAHAEPDLALLNDAILLAEVTSALRELLFPFRHVAHATKAILRPRMGPDDLRPQLGTALEILEEVRKDTQSEREAHLGAADLEAVLGKE